VVSKRSGQNQVVRTRWLERKKRENEKVFNHKLDALKKLHIIHIGVEAPQLSGNAAHSKGKVATLRNCTSPENIE